MYKKVTFATNLHKFSPTLFDLYFHGQSSAEAQECKKLCQKKDRVEMTCNIICVIATAGLYITILSLLMYLILVYGSSTTIDKGVMMFSATGGMMTLAWWVLYPLSKRLTDSYQSWMFPEPDDEVVRFFSNHTRLNEVLRCKSEFFGEQELRNKAERSLTDTCIKILEAQDEKDHAKEMYLRMTVLKYYYDTCQLFHLVAENYGPYFEAAATLRKEKGGNVESEEKRS